MLSLNSKRLRWLICQVLLLIVFYSFFSHGAGSSAAQQQSATASPDSDLTLFSLTITDKTGRLVTGIRQEFFQVYFDGALQKISFFSNQEQSASVVFLVDLSGSMGSSYINKSNKVKLVVDSLERCFEKHRFDNEYSVISFNDKIERSLDWTKNTADVVSELRKLATPFPKGKTALYEAFSKAIQQVQTGTNRIKTVVVLSDGEDSEGQGKDRSYLIEQSRRADVLLIGIDPTRVALSNLERRNLSFRESTDVTMKKLIISSGGLLYQPHIRENVEAAVCQTFDHIRFRYRIGFKPEVTGRQKFHRIKVKVVIPPNTIEEFRQLSVRHRDGYSFN